MAKHRKRRTKSEWAEIVEQWRGSGLSQKAFAKRRGLAAGTLSWWSRELRVRSSDDPAPEFVAVEVAGSESSGVARAGSTDRVAGVIRTAGGDFLVAADADPGWVAAVLSGLGRC